MTNFFPSADFVTKNLNSKDEYAGYYKKQWFKVRLNPTGNWSADVYSGISGKDLITDARLDALLFRIYQRLHKEVSCAAA